MFWTNTSNEFDCWTGKEKESLLIDDILLCWVLLVAWVKKLFWDLELGVDHPLAKDCKS